MEAKPVPEDIYETLVWPNYLKNEKNKEKNFGGVGDILVLDSIKETPEEMPDKAIKFIFNKKDIKRNLEKEQNFLAFLNLSLFYALNQHIQVDYFYNFYLPMTVWTI